MRALAFVIQPVLVEGFLIFEAEIGQTFLLLTLYYEAQCSAACSMSGLLVVGKPRMASLQFGLGPALLGQHRLTGRIGKGNSMWLLGIGGVARDAICTGALPYASCTCREDTLESECRPL